jgi:cell division protease FtsH
MVTRWGLSERLGPLVYGEEEGEVFLGRTMSKRKEVSEGTAQAIDEEIRLIIDRNCARAESILKDNLEKLHAMADALMKYETIDEDQIRQIIAGEVPSPPAGWNDDDTSHGKTVTEPPAASDTPNTISDTPKDESV